MIDFLEQVKRMTLSEYKRLFLGIPEAEEEKPVYFIAPMSFVAEQAAQKVGVPRHLFRYVYDIEVLAGVKGNGVIVVNVNWADRRMDRVLNYALIKEKRGDITLEFVEL